MVNSFMDCQAGGLWAEAEIAWRGEVLVGGGGVHITPFHQPRLHQGLGSFIGGASSVLLSFLLVEILTWSTH